MPAGDIHIIDGVRYQLVDAGPGTVLGLLHPDTPPCYFCAFHAKDGCNWLTLDEPDHTFLCGDDYLFFIKLEEIK